MYIGLHHFRLHVVYCVPSPCSTRSHTPQHARTVSAYPHGRACSTLGVHAKLAVGSSRDVSLEIWPVTDSAVTSALAVTMRRPLG